MITEAIHLFDNTLRVTFNECFPVIKVSSRPPPPSIICCHWLNTCVPSKIGMPRNADLQAKINELIRNNQVEAVRNGNRKHGTGTKGWWNTANNYGYYGYTKDQLSELFDSLTMSLFLYGLKVWGSAYQNKHLHRIDGLFRRGYPFCYRNNLRSFSYLM